MALISCPECGKDISDMSSTCIHCGFPIRQQESPAAATQTVVEHRTTAAKEDAGDKKKKRRIPLIILIILFLIIRGAIFREKSEPVVEAPPSAPLEYSVDSYLALIHYFEDTYVGQPVQVAGQVGSITSAYFELSDNFNGKVLKARIEPSEKNELGKVSEGDFVVINGIISKKSENTLHFNQASVVSVGGEAESSYSGNRQAYLEILENQKREYIAESETIKYSDLVRTPDKYSGKVIKVQVEIAQVMEGGLLSDSGYRGYEGRSFDREWVIPYSLPEGEARILDGDIVAFYGEFEGLREMTRGLTGTKVQIPSISAVYHTIVKAGS